MAGSAYEAEIAAWRQERERGLVSEDGWLAQVALHPLGDEPVVVDIGSFTAAGDGARFVAAAGADVRLGDRPVAEVVVRDDLSDGDVLVSGTRRYQLVRRGDTASVRVRDAAAPARAAFRGLSWYPVRERWRITGRLALDPHAATMQFTLGEEELATSPGRVAFEVGGVACQLTPYQRPDGQLLFVFRDPTNADATCELCRYFYAPPPDADGRVVLDFNKAAAPACAFAPSVTCVLPPPENRLAVRIEAGELRYTPTP